MLPAFALPPGSFARCEPFSDGRRIIVRRGKELGCRYGLELSRREVSVGGARAWLVRFRELLSPPAANPHLRPLSAQALRPYQPESELLYVPGAEILIPREPVGFTDEEVTMILRALELEAP